MLSALARIPYATTLWILGGAFALEALLLGLAPLHRDDWLLENALVVAFLGLAFVAHRRMPLSRLSWLLIFVFLGLHEIGAHYTYAEVPYDDWFRSAFGWTLSERLGLGRNHFDRLVHFAYGLLLAYPIRELFLRVGDARGFWGYFLPLDLTMSTSMLYELVEWGAALLFGGGPRRRVPRDPGRRLGRAQGHGAREPRGAHRDERDGARQRAPGSRLRA